MEEKQREAVVYLFVKDFAYKDKNYEEMMGGHPKVGRIYRALFDQESKIYRVIVEEDDKSEAGLAGLMITKLVNDDARWRADMEIFDDESILNYDILSEDFLRLGKWKEVDNADIDYLRYEASANGVEIEQEENGITKVIFSSEDDSEENFTDNILSLAETDYELAKAVDKTLEGILHYLSSISVDYPDLTQHLSSSKTAGKGVNIGLAVEALSEYINNDPASRGTLNKAVYYLLREMARINK
jgi:hypothetical protein